MDKEILIQYIDACEIIKETRREIQELKKQKRRTAQDIVKGSSQEFPYTMHSIRIDGITSGTRESKKLEEREKILARQLEQAEDIRQQVEEWMITVPQRIQRIIRYRFFEQMTWGAVAVRMGRKATAESIRKELENFLKSG